ncbi:MAG: hypothetical protein FJ265_18835, partial [Planctomycetes bacterium]|nr:hypothetical protein [Planctomycetota bacterium]
MFRSAIVPLLATGLAAQGASPVPTVPAAPAQPALSADCFRIAEPVYDQRTDGSLHATGPAWVATFDQGGASFTPYLGSDAERTWPIRFALRGVTVAGKAAATGPALPQRQGHRVAFARGAAVEWYDLNADGMEQCFRFDSLPARGELRLHIAAEGDLEPTLASDGVRFLGPRGGVHYGAAVAIDARGERQAVATELVAGGLA